MKIHNEIKAMVDRIVKNYKPEKIILFGSFALGKPNIDSDIDLFVECKEEKITGI